MAEELININGDISLDDLEQFIENGRLLVKFGEVTGDFRCYGLDLTTLEGCPRVVGGDFICSNNWLKSLTGGPQTVGGKFFCSDNLLTNLNGGPRLVGDYFRCDHNKLTSLEGAPKRVGGTFDCQNNPDLPDPKRPPGIRGGFWHGNGDFRND